MDQLPFYYKKLPINPLGTLLRHHRLRRQWSMRYVAQLAGVPTMTYRNWEYGKRGMPLLNAVRVARALGLTLDEMGRAAEESVGWVPAEYHFDTD